MMKEKAQKLIAENSDYSVLCHTENNETISFKFRKLKALKKHTLKNVFSCLSTYCVCKNFVNIRIKSLCKTWDSCHLHNPQKMFYWNVLTTNLLKLLF